MSFHIPGADFAFDAPANDPVGTYGLFITEDGTLDVDYFAQYSDTDEAFGNAYDVAIYDYEAVWNNADVTFEVTNTKHLIDAPYTHTAKVSGFFLTAASIVERDGENTGYNYFVGIVLSAAQAEEYRQTGKIAAYPDFDWSVLGPVNPKADDSGSMILWVVIGGAALLGIAGVIFTQRKRKA
jgi:LPXTG-motif cell wall-anchored protein